MDYDVGTFIWDWVATPTSLKILNEKDEILYEGESAYVPNKLETLTLLRITVRDNYLVLVVEEYEEE